MLAKRTLKLALPPRAATMAEGVQEDPRVTARDAVMWKSRTRIASGVRAMGAARKASSARPGSLCGIVGGGGGGGPRTHSCCGGRWCSSTPARTPLLTVVDTASDSRTPPRLPPLENPPAAIRAALELPAPLTIRCLRPPSRLALMRACRRTTASWRAASMGVARHESVDLLTKMKMGRGFGGILSCRVNLSAGGDCCAGVVVVLVMAAML
jgi:hypothetical protein